MFGDIHVEQIDGGGDGGRKGHQKQAAAFRRSVVHQGGRILRAWKVQFQLLYHHYHLWGLRLYAAVWFHVGRLHTEQGETQSRNEVVAGVVP